MSNEKGLDGEFRAIARKNRATNVPFASTKWSNQRKTGGSPGALLVWATFKPSPGSTAAEQRSRDPTGIGGQVL
jgi:hypothetical protein